MAFLEVTGGESAGALRMMLPIWVTSMAFSVPSWVSRLLSWVWACCLLAWAAVRSSVPSLVARIVALAALQVRLGLVLLVGEPHDLVADGGLGVGLALGQVGLGDGVGAVAGTGCAVVLERDVEHGGIGLGGHHHVAQKRPIVAGALELLAHGIGDVVGLDLDLFGRRVDLCRVAPGATDDIVDARDRLDLDAGGGAVGRGPRWRRRAAR